VNAAAYWAPSRAIRGAQRAKLRPEFELASSEFELASSELELASSITQLELIAPLCRWAASIWLQNRLHFASISGANERTFENFEPTNEIEANSLSPFPPSSSRLETRAP